MVAVPPSFDASYAQERADKELLRDVKELRAQVHMIKMQIDSLAPAEALRYQLILKLLRVILLFTFVIAAGLAFLIVKDLLGR